MSLSKDNSDIIKRYYYPTQWYNLQLRNSLTGKAHPLFGVTYIFSVLFDFLTQELFATSAIIHSCGKALSSSKSLKILGVSEQIKR